MQFMWMHDLPYLPCCISALMASMNGHLNACLWHQSKKYKENPNLSMLKANKLLNKGTETWKHKKGNETETYYVK